MLKKINQNVRTQKLTTKIGAHNLVRISVLLPVMKEYMYSPKLAKDGRD